MGKQEAPTPPNVQQTAQAQTQSNVDTALATARLNAVNQTSPFGSVTYSEGPKNAQGIPTYTQSTNLSPELKAVFDKAIAGQNSIADATKTMAAALPGQIKGITAPSLRMNLGDNDFSADRQRVEDALFTRLDERLGKDRTALETDLSNKGISINSDAYRNAQGDFGRNVNDARIAAILGAGQEQNRLQSLALNDANFANSAAQQSFGNDIARNNQYINQVLALMNGAPVTQPQFGATPQTGVAGTDIAGLVQQNYANQNNAYNQNQAAWGGALGTLGNIGAAALPFILSDERTKEDIEYTGEFTEDGIPEATFRYAWEPEGTQREGVIAQDVAAVRPDAVGRIGGLMLVDSSKVPEAA